MVFSVSVWPGTSAATRAGRVPEGTPGFYRITSPTIPCVFLPPPRL